MRLRSRLLLLIALLVSAALAASFWVIFRAVRLQTLADLDRSLESAQHVWQSLSRAQAQSLATTTSGMAAEAGFVQVLRQTDRATLLDYLRQTQENNPSLDLLAVFDESGKLRVCTDPSFQPGASDLLLNSALDGTVGASFWQGSDSLFLAAAAPIYKQDSRLEGVLLLGTRLDSRYVETLAQDTGVQVALLPNRGTGFTTSSLLLGVQPPSLRLRSAPLPDYAGSSLGRFVLGRDLNAALAYVHTVYGQLFGLGVAVLGLAFLISIPLVGRMTNPVVLLEKTQAEMDAVFQANSDGLVALDQEGRVVHANPAAAICFGLELERLAGQNLQQLLPEEVLARLVATAPSQGQLVQRSLWRREGRNFQLTRTFVASQHLEVGSVLVTRELAAEADSDNPIGLLKGLTTRPQSPEEWLEFEKVRANLLWLSGQRDSDQSSPADWASAFQEMSWQAPTLRPNVSISRDCLRVILLNFWPGEAPELVAEEGGWWLVGSRPPLNLEREVLSGVAQENDGRLLEGSDGRPRLWLPCQLPC
ncbi:PAS domain-containing protein [bacterium]|nr:PAS domain-containing protein [bacterium]